MGRVTVRSLGFLTVPLLSVGGDPPLRTAWIMLWYWQSLERRPLATW